MITKPNNNNKMEQQLLEYEVIWNVPIPRPTEVEIQIQKEIDYYW